jgi:enediyne biosynthesis protein E4
MPRLRLAFLLALALPAAAAGSDPSEHPTPAPDPGAASLAERSRRQEVAWRGLGRGAVPFRLTDRARESGITFVHRAVEDAGKHYKAVHYDHGNGVAIADVDGDGLPDIYFTNQVGGNELWRNLGGGRFENITTLAGVALETRISVGAAFADADNDGDPDLFVTTVRGGNVLFENLGGGRFRDVTAESGLGYLGHSSGAVWFDYDLDGRLDLFVANIGSYTTDRSGSDGEWTGREDAFSGHLYPERTELSLLYRNLGGLRFAEVSRATGLADPGWTGDAIALDADGDGYPDLHALNMQGDDRTWRNVAGQRFENATDRFFPHTSWGSMGAAVLDADGDGRLDLFVTDMHSDMSAPQTLEEEARKSVLAWSDAQLGGDGGADHIFGNALFRGLGGGRYEEISDRYGVETYWPWGPSTGDFDADGFEDLFVTAGMGFPFPYHPSSLLLNDAGRRFFPIEFLAGVEPRPEAGTQIPWFTLDCSGADARVRFCRARTGVHRVTGTPSARSAAIVDLEGDGDLDLVVAEFHSGPRIFLNDLAQRSEVRRLELALVGTRSNRDGLGAVVRLSIGDRVQVRQHDGKSGYLAQSSLPLYFGLGAATHADEIVVRWPSGIEQRVPGPISPGRLELREPADSAAPPAHAAG